MTKPEDKASPRGRHDHTCRFEDIQASEREAVHARRKALERPDVASDLVGLALSGGGIRSASFCLGVLQALDSKEERLKQIDYLSTVSGGGYIGACLTTCMNARQGKSHFNEDNGYGDTPAISHVRDFSNYLIPRGFGDVITAVGLLGRGLLANAILVAPLFIVSVGALLYSRPSLDSLGNYGALQSSVDWLDAHKVPFLPGFPATTGMLVLLLLTLLLWVIGKAVAMRLVGADPNARQRLRDSPELQGGFVNAWRFVLALTAFVAWLELQPIVLKAIVDASPVLKSCFGSDASQSCVQSLLGNWFKVATPALAPLRDRSRLSVPAAR